MEVVWIFPGSVFVRLAKQECHLQPTRRSRHSNLVETTTIATGRLHSACSVFFSRHSACATDCVVGSASRWSNRAGMDLEWDPASDARRTCRLFLFCQARLARGPCLHLSAVATGKRLVLFVPHNSAGSGCVSLDFAPANRERTVCGRGCFHRYVGPDPRVHEL